MTAVKFNEDEKPNNTEGYVQNNQFFSRVGGISNEQLNQLEGQFLQDIKYSLLVSPELY